MVDALSGCRRRCSPVLLAALAGVMVLATAGCGGKSADEKARETYANSVCVAIAGWQTQVKGIATDVSAGISRASLQSKVTRIDSATKSLVQTVKALPPPNTSQGEATKQQLDQLDTDLANTVASIKVVAAGLKADTSAATIAAAVITLGPQLQGLATTAQSSIAALKSSKGAMSKAFKDAESCQSLGSSS